MEETKPAEERSYAMTMLEDTNLVAYLKLCGYVAVPFRCLDDPRDPNRVAFNIEGSVEDVEAATKEFYSNKLVGVQDFCRCIKEIKSVTHALRKLRQS